MNLSFEYPYFFLLILLFLFLEIFFSRKNSSIYFPHIDILKKYSNKSRDYLFILKWIAIISLTFTIASPYESNKIEKHNHKGHDIFLVVDASGSMKNSFSIIDNSDKFTASKKIVSKFILSRKGDNIGLMIFADSPVLISPLTYDKKSIVNIFRFIDVGVAGTSTGLYDAMLESIRFLKKSKLNKKIIILLTDGVNTTGVTSKNIVYEALKDYKNIKVYTIGVGVNGDFDEDTLKLFAEVSGGKFYSANRASSLIGIYDDIDNIEKITIRSKNIVLKTYYYSYSLVIAFVTFLLFILLKIRRSY